MWYNGGMVRYIVLAIFFVGVSIIMFTNPFDFSQEMRDAIVPWATLALAFVAIFTIVHSDVKEGRRRNIERLADIMDWIESIIQETHVIETIEPTNFSGGSDTYEILQTKDKINDFNRFGLLGNHMQILARRIDIELYVSVRTLSQAMRDLTNEDWTSPGLIDARKMLKTHEERIYSIAKPLLDDIVKRIERC